MKQIQTFDPSLATSGTIDTIGVNKNEQLMLYNDSLVGLLLTFSDGSINVIPASWNKSFTIENVPMGKVRWTQLYAIGAIGYPISSCYGVIYEDGEHVPEVNAGMQRGFQILSGAIQANTLSNDGNPGGLTVIEMTQLLATGSNVVVKNDGTVVIAMWNATTGYIQLFQIIPNFSINSGKINMGSSLTVTENLGTLVVDRQLNVVGQTTLDNNLIFTDTLGNLQLNGPKGLIANALQVDGATINQNGSTSGSCKITQYFTGVLKHVEIVFNAYVNNVSVQTVVLPTAFTLTAKFEGMGNCPWQVKKAGVVQNVNVLTTIAAGGGTITNQTFAQTNSDGYVGTSGFDSIVFPIQATSYTGVLKLEGQ